MDKTFCLVPAEETKKILQKLGFKTIKLNSVLSVFVAIKDLPQIKESVTEYYLLDDDGTEINNDDIKKLMTSEDVSEDV